MKKIVILILLFVFLVGCSNIDSNVIFNLNGNLGEDNVDYINMQENITYIKVYFCPRDRCKDHLITLIESANESVHCGLFDLDLKDLKQTFEKMSYLVDTRLVIDDENFDPYLAKKEYVRWDDTSQLTHNKFCIIDNKIISTGSFNPTHRGNFVNNNNLVIIDSKLLAENYEAEFRELWHYEFSGGDKVLYPIIETNFGVMENYFCPEDQCKNNVVRVLASANESIKFMTFSHTHDDTGDILVKKHFAGINVQGVFERTQNNAWCEYERLEKYDLNIKWDENKANMHHKVFIVDEKIVITGSFNPSSNGDTNNDENVLIIYNEDIAKQYVEEFDYVWSYSPNSDLEVRNVTNLVIKKVMYDPVGADKGNEYVVLFNVGSNEIDLSEFKLEDHKANYQFSGVIKPDEEFKYESSRLSLKNSEGMLYLKNEYNELVDFVAWEGFEEWSLEDKKGEGLVRTKFDVVNNEGEWK
tara:strand:+ start:24240 stop:25649 length:1410 start_codon:yes stop_codon:yes gene_type:complete